MSTADSTGVPTISALIDHILITILGFEKSSYDYIKAKAGVGLRRLRSLEESDLREMVEEGYITLGDFSQVQQWQWFMEVENPTPEEIMAMTAGEWDTMSPRELKEKYLAYVNKSCTSASPPPMQTYQPETPFQDKNMTNHTSPSPLSTQTYRPGPPQDKKITNRFEEEVFENDPMPTDKLSTQIKEPVKNSSIGFKRSTLSQSLNRYILPTVKISTSSLNKYSLPTVVRNTNESGTNLVDEDDLNQSSHTRETVDSNKCPLLKRNKKSGEKKRKKKKTLDDKSDENVGKIVDVISEINEVEPAVKDSIVHNLLTNGSATVATEETPKTTQENGAANEPNEVTGEENEGFDDDTQSVDQSGDEATGIDSVADGVENRHILAGKRKFEEQKQELMNRISSQVKNDFRKIGFSRWQKKMLPVIQISPFDVEPGSVRKQWKKMFESKIRQRRQPARLILWYGHVWEERSEAYSFISKHMITSYETGVKKGFDKLPSSVQKKMDEGVELTDQEAFQVRGLEQMKVDLSLPPAKRIKTMTQFEEDYDEYIAEIIRQEKKLASNSPKPSLLPAPKKMKKIRETSAQKTREPLTEETNQNDGEIDGANGQVKGQEKNKRSSPVRVDTETGRKSNRVRKRSKRSIE